MIICILLPQLTTPDDLDQSREYDRIRHNANVVHTNQNAIWASSSVNRGPMAMLIAP